MKLTVRIVGAALSVSALIWTGAAQAHCDTLDGPVVSAARTALESGDVDRVLVWVKPGDESQIRGAFRQAREVRALGGEAQQLADTHFFETLVRVHRAGEGAPYTGLKPAGEVEAPIAAADRAISTGTLQDVAKLVSARMETGLHERFEAVASKKDYRPEDVDAGRAFVAAYVDFIHYAERLYEAAGSAADEAHAAEVSAHAH